MNELKIFENEEFGKVEVIMIDEKPYFRAIEIAKALGYSNPHDAINRHCKGVVKHEVLTKGGLQEASFIPEGDVYRLTIGSKLPGAAKFESWLFDSVVPTIRKTGMYMAKPLTFKDTLKIALELEERNELLQIENEEMKPKALFADAVATSKTTILVGELAKLIKQNGYDIGGKRLFAWLRDSEYLCKQEGSQYNMPTQKSMDLGLFEIKESSYIHCDGHVSITKTPKVTGKGQQYFINKFLNKGYGE